MNNNWNFHPSLEARLKNRIIIKLKYQIHEECLICSKDLYNTTISYTPCEHRFHTKCLRNQLKNQHYLTRSCIKCRRNLTFAYNGDTP